MKLVLVKLPEVKKITKHDKSGLYNVDTPDKITSLGV